MMKMGVGKDLLHLFHIPVFDESLRMAEGLFRRRETASEGREREGTQSQREEGTTKKSYVTEREEKCQQIHHNS